MGYHYEVLHPTPSSHEPDGACSPAGDSTVLPRLSRHSPLVLPPSIERRAVNLWKRVWAILRFEEQHSERHGHGA